MYVKDKQVQHEKYVDKPVDLLIERYKALAEYEPMIHLRMKTHGLIDHTNTHPYPCKYGMWLMHNGVLSSGNQKDTQKSDTWHFINDVFNPLLEWSKNPHKMIRSKQFIEIMERAIGYSNRIVVADREGFVFYNVGTWVTIQKESTGVKGLRVSNSYAWNESFKEPRPTQQYHYGTSGRGGSSSPTAISHWYQLTNEGLILIDEDLWVDNSGEFWEYTGYGYQRMGLSRKQEKKAKKALERAARRQPKGQVIDLTAVNKKPQEPVLLLPQRTQQVCIPGTEPILVVNQDEDNDEETSIVEMIVANQKTTDDEYNEALVNEWKRYPPDVINTMCYTDPDDAAKVLTKVLHDI